MHLNVSYVFSKRMLGMLELEPFVVFIDRCKMSQDDKSPYKDDIVPDKA